jgi:hypothetical protein
MCLIQMTCLLMKENPCVGIYMVLILIVIIHLILFVLNLEQLLSSFQFTRQ